MSVDKTIKMSVCQITKMSVDKTTKMSVGQFFSTDRILTISLTIPEESFI